ncbi:unnamed protein product [Caenorhabditis sp. 36 PRJEB53466]|nr:unnamed protein product [Caenorhabditis sp. 36 PRJEB53466]
MNRRRNIGIEIGEEQHYGGSVVTIMISMIYMAVFANTMIRFLNGGSGINVVVQRPPGQNKKIQIKYDPIPDNLTWSAKLYKMYLRFAPAVWVWKKCLDFYDDRSREYRIWRRHREAERLVRLGLPLVRYNAVKKTVDLKKVIQIPRIVIHPPSEHRIPMVHYIVNEEAAADQLLQQMPHMQETFV